MPNEETAFLVNEYMSLWSEHGVELTHAKPSARPTITSVAKAPAAAPPTLSVLEDVRAWIGECTRCGLCGGRKKIVFGTGEAKARLLFVGEGPGQEEDAQGIPFVGPSGLLLTKIIEAMGYERDSVYLANVVKCRPPQDRLPSPQEVASCLPFLKAQVDLIAPTLVVALGAMATQALTGESGALGTLRGKFHQVSWKREIPVMPTYHPAYLLRNPDAKRTVWEDMKLVVARLQTHA